MFQVGDKVKLNGCPFDEQIAEEAMMYAFLVTQTMTVTRVSKQTDLDAPWSGEGDGSNIEDQDPDGTFIKTDMIPDWTSQAWFVKAE